MKVLEIPEDVVNEVVVALNMAIGFAMAKQDKSVVDALSAASCRLDEASIAGQKQLDGYGLALKMIAAGCDDPRSFAAKTLAKAEKLSALKAARRDIDRNPPYGSDWNRKHG